MGKPLSDWRDKLSKEAREEVIMLEGKLRSKREERAEIDTELDNLSMRERLMKKMNWFGNSDDD